MNRNWLRRVNEMNYDYDQWVKDWNSTLEQLRLVISEKDAPPPIIKEPATKEEIEAVEKQLGYQLPSTFRHTLMHFSKEVHLYWSIDEQAQTLPPEISESVFGEIRWSIDELEDLEELAEELDFEGYRSPLHGKLQFMHVANGDIIAFDMQVTGEPIVVYWDHETDELTYLADSFHSFIEKLNELHCVGNEIWRYEPFLTDKGLDTNSENAQNWKKWFSSFVSRDRN